MTALGTQRVALALVATFAAHTFAVLVTEPAPRARFRDQGRPVAVAGSKQAIAAVGPLPAPARMPARKASGATGGAAGDRAARGHGATDVRPAISAYEGLGSWVDLFDRSPWRNPSWTVRRMDRKGVRTIYLQTATYGSTAPVVYPKKVAEFIASAHRRGMAVVGWSVPSFKTPEKDFWRARAGVTFETGNGERFDSFALDIESDIVDNIWLRNHRLLDLTRKIRQVAGDDYPLGAIIPDSHSLYWPGFPYEEVAARYEVLIPMAYSTFRTHGYRGVRDYTASNIRTIKRETGDPEVPIHVIGGIADDVGVPAARGFVRAIKDHGALGASLYDFPITTEETWAELSKLRSR